MASSQDSIFTSLTFVLGIFIGFIVAGVLALTGALFGPGTPAGQASEDEAALVEQRLAPVGRIALIGDDELAAARAAAQAAAAPPPAPASGPPRSGAETFDEACYLCHAPPGVPGSPLVGDAAAWAPRFEQGLETLEEHAINGFQGEVGAMPPKGGRVDLSDDEVRAAVRYMLEQAGIQ